MQKDLIVKKSAIHGKGVFAGRNFKKGEIVIEWDLTHPLTKKEAESLGESEKQYLDEFNGKLFLMQPPGRYVNHSCDANTAAKDFADVAKRDIRKGEEITADYSETAPKGFEMKCCCKAKNCRKTILRKKRGK